ncbi:MAG: hypothetical protein O3C43_17735 [Verrucomicrobia bacterium]|nr:hypothetical protein [Verrucomicrobiota bacterium]
MKNTLTLIIGALLLWNDVFAQSAFPGERGKNLDIATREDIWDREPNGFLEEFVRVDRDKVIAFAIYTQQAGSLKMTAQLFPLKPNEKREVALEFKKDEEWKKAKTAKVNYPGWYAHFRIDNWDGSKDVPYRVTHSGGATFKGLIRKDPVNKQEIVVASMSCNSSRDRGDRESIVANVRAHDPDLLFFAGDQSYDHRELTAGWTWFGFLYRDIIKDRPTITIIDDHDIGQGNFWGEGGIIADATDGSSGGYYYPHEYIKMIHEQSTWHLPDPFDPTPIEQGIQVYYTDVKVGEVSFAVIEDRKFKSGPKGKIPEMGPRPDHINDESYDRNTVDLPGLKLLGDRQLHFLNEWSQDWEGVEMKAVLSQTAFTGAVHLHGSFDNGRLLADLDSNAWPQTGRNKALTAIRRAWAPHLCGDQHLAVVVQHGIENHRDGPFGFTNPALVNTIYGRWWWPENGEAGGGTPIDNELEWTGDYLDGLGNRMTMHTYANPNFKSMNEARDLSAQGGENNLEDGYGVARFNKATRTITFECWPRFGDVTKPGAKQYTGWPLTIRQEDNDGREVYGYLPELVFEGMNDPVVQVIEEGSKEILYTVRIQGNTFLPKVYSNGKYTVKAGKDRPDGFKKTGLKPTAKKIKVKL